MSAPVRVFLSGEGSNELGAHAKGPAFRDAGAEESEPGALCALLRKVQPEGWRVGEAKLWKDVHKLVVGAARGGRDRHQDTRNVLKIALHAEEAGHQVLAFSRDLDADDEREEAIEKGIHEAEALCRDLGIVGSIAVPALEGWVLALQRVPKTELFSRKKAQAELSSRGVEPKDGAAMVKAIEQANLDQIPGDATSLLRWLGRARTVLPAKIARSKPAP